MRLFAALTLLALGLFWSHPFLGPQMERNVRPEAAAMSQPGEPVLVLAPKDVRVRPEAIVAENLRESSEDPRR